MNGVYWLSQDLTVKHKIYDFKGSTEYRLASFCNELCLHKFKTTKLNRFKGKQRQDDFDIPESLGVIHTICATNILLISGNKGFAVYDTDYRCIYTITLSYNIKGKIFYADSYNE